MQQEFKMNSEKKAYSKPVMEVVEMDYSASIMACSGACDDVIDTETDENADAGYWVIETIKPKKGTASAVLFYIPKFFF